MSGTISPPQTPPRSQSSPQSASTAPETSTVHYAFTPNADIRVTKAWQRKPATPFAPRNESHKIWKRPTVRDLSSHDGFNRNLHGSDEQRAIKRIRADGSAREDKHDVRYIGTRWEEGHHEGRHKVQDAAESTAISSTDSTKAGSPPDVEIEIEQEVNCHDNFPRGDTEFNGDKRYDSTHDAIEIGSTVTLSAKSDSDAQSFDHPSTIDTNQSESKLSVITLSQEGHEITSHNTSNGKGATEPRECSLGSLLKTTQQSQGNVPFGDQSQSDPHSPHPQSPDSSANDQALSAVSTVTGPEDLASQAEKGRHDLLSTAQIDSTTKAPEQILQNSTSIHSEDTEYLHAFLTRARARKAEQALSPQKVDPTVLSPTKQQREALAPLSANSPSPKKMGKSFTTEDPDENETNILSDNTTSLSPRRSARAHLPRPQKSVALVPSSIPVRRTKGAEVIFLQRDEAQQTAVTTRSNTKRNKGEAVMPKYRVKALTEEPRSPSRSPKKRKTSSKEVSWNNEPTYFNAGSEKSSEGSIDAEAEDSKPKARKVRRLGAVNGTPAAKRTKTEDATDLITPATKRREKSRHSFSGRSRPRTFVGRIVQSLGV